MKTIYQLLEGFSSSEINNAIESLNDDEKNIIRKRFGDDLTENNYNNPLNQEEIKIFHKRVIPKIRRRLNNKKEFKKKIYDYFEGFSKEEIDLAITRLPDEDRNLLYLKYGKDLDNPCVPANWDKKMTEDFSFKVLRRLRKALNNPEFVPNSKKSIYTTLKQYSKEQIDEAIKHLTEEELEYISLRYSNCELSEKERNRVYTRLHQAIIPKIKYFIDNGKPMLRQGHNLSSIYTYLNGYSKEEIDTVIARLSTKEKELIRARYGDDLSNPKTSDNWNKTLCSRFYYILIPKMRKMLDHINDDTSKNGRKLLTIYEYFNEYSEEDINKVIKSLPKEDKKIIYYRYGSDLHNPVTRKEWNSKLNNKFYVNIIAKMKRRLLKNAKPVRAKEVKQRTKSIYDYFDKKYSKQEIDYAISNLNEKDKQMLFLKYGSDLSNPVRSEEWNMKLANKFNSNLIPKLRRMLSNSGERVRTGGNIRSIYTVLSDYSKEEIDKAISMLDERDKELLFERYGSDLSNPKQDNFSDKDKIKSFYSITFRKIKTLVKRIHTKEDYINLSNVLRSSMFNTMINYISSTDALNVFKELGLISKEQFNKLDVEEKEVDKEMLLMSRTILSKNKQTKILKK